MVRLRILAYSSLETMSFSHFFSFEAKFLYREYITPINCFFSMALHLSLWCPYTVLLRVRNKEDHSLKLEKQSPGGALSKNCSENFFKNLREPLFSKKLLKKRLQLKVFPCEFFKTAFLQNTSEQLLLKLILKTPDPR